MTSNTYLVALTLTLGTLSMASGQAPAGPTGRYGAVMEYDPSHVPAQTVYRPRDIGNLKNIPIVAYGNGGCLANGGASARQFLMQVASEGYLITTPAKPGPDPEIRPVDATPAAPPTGAAMPPRPAGNTPAAMPTDTPATMSAELNNAIDWAIAENSRKGSVYYGKLDTRKVAVAGHSCGGLQALEASIDPRVVTGLIFNSGTFEGTPLRGTSMTKEKLKQLHATLAYIHGGPADVAYKNSLDDYQRITTAPVFLADSGVGHGGTFRQINGGEYAKVATAWLNWQLKGDKSAAAMFTGANCMLCTDPRWKVARKGMN